jgi:hypothetical protein
LALFPLNFPFYGHDADLKSFRGETGVRVNGHVRNLLLLHRFRTFLFGTTLKNHIFRSRYAHRPRCTCRLLLQFELHLTSSQAPANKGCERRMTLSSPQVAGIHAAQDHHLPGRLRYQSTWPTSYSTAAEIRVAGFAVWAASKSLSTANCISLRTDGDNWIRTTTDEFSEGYHIAMQTLDQYRGTIIVCSYYPPPSLLLPETLPLLKASFHDAISRVVLAQPHLDVGIICEK